MQEEKKYHSISRRMPIMISVGFLIMLAIVVTVTFFRIEKRMINEYRRMADGVTNLMIEALDPEKMDYYIEENYSSPEYMSIMKYFYQLKDNYPDVYYMYVYRFYKDGDVPYGTIIIDLEDEYTDTPNQVSIEWVGGTYDVLEPFASRIDEMLGSREPVYDTAYSKEDGYLLSFAKPIYDSKGNYVASACVDFSMAELHGQNIRFIIILCFILILATGVMLFLAFYILKTRVTKPLLLIANTVSGFKYDSEEDCSSNLQQLEDLDIRSNNEIGVLYEALLTAEKESVFYMGSYMRAEDTIQIKDERISKLGDLALRDSMTHVGNKTAFTMQISELHDDDVYGIVLMDANNLKMINDTYGHEAGDEYIKGCCELLCRIYAHSPVFRIGGDEFAVILKGRDYEDRDRLQKEIRAEFAAIWDDRKDDPIHRYSGSVGMADSTTCMTARETIKTADDNMYEDKKAFKEKNGSYR
ncbi:MAG: GGDEF domain-containing protein [Lachnospiraceae bacterium]|nr:GGDEF domain-containing protein [Lachnospiraceae bacterium]